MQKSIKSLEELNKFTQSLFSLLSPGTICLLNGPMGSGKTTFVSSYMSHMNFFDVSSPSYSLVQEYRATVPVFHIDLYRMESEVEVEMLDLEYYFQQNDHLVFIEWASKLTFLNRPYVEILIERSQNGTRVFSVKDNR